MKIGNGCTIALLAIACLQATVSGASTFRPLEFGEVVEGAEMVVAGRVTELRYLTTGTTLGRLEPNPEEVSSPRAGDGRVLHGTERSAQSAGVEGGRMVFTEVTFEVEQEILGDAAGEITFRVAGGRDGARQLVVHGMPSFELEQRYIVFLRPGYETTAVPIVGVHQGFFEIQGDAPNELILDHDGNLVIGVDESGIRVRHFTDGEDREMPRLGDAPHPSAGVRRSGTSPETLSYWLSDAPSMTVDAFGEAIRSQKEAR